MLWGPRDAQGRQAWHRSSLLCPPLPSRAWQQLKVLGHAKAFLHTWGLCPGNSGIWPEESTEQPTDSLADIPNKQTNKKIQGFVLLPAPTNPPCWLWCTPWNGLQLLGQAWGQDPGEGLPLKTVQNRSSKTFSQISASPEHRSGDPDLPHHSGRAPRGICEGRQRSFLQPVTPAVPCKYICCMWKTNNLLLSTPLNSSSNISIREKPQDRQGGDCAGRWPAEQRDLLDLLRSPERSAYRYGGELYTTGMNVVCGSVCARANPGVSVKRNISLPPKRLQVFPSSTKLSRTHLRKDCHIALKKQSFWPVDYCLH